MANGKNGTGVVASNDFQKSNGLTARDTATYNDEPSMTRQEYKDECDINTIMAQYDKYLADPMRSLREPVYVDFTEMPDTLMGTMELVQKAADAFMTLPATVRREFDNDPVAFADYAADPTNLEQMREWGLAAPQPVAEPPMRVEVVNAPPGAENGSTPVST